MKKAILRLVILFLIFAGCVVGFSWQLNSKETTRETGFSEPSLPVFFMQASARTTNRMAGHIRELNEQSERSAVTPLSTDRTLTVQIRGLEGSPDGNVSYQVTSLADGEIMENGRVNGFSEQGGLQTAVFTLQQPIAAGREYMLRFTLNRGEEEPVYYYTRLTQTGNVNPLPYLEFVERFYTECISGNQDMDIDSWIETTPEGSAGGLEHVTIHSSEGQLRWRSLKPELFRHGAATFKEINATTASVAIEYTIRATRGGVEEYYAVSDFYRLRADQDKIYLLDLDRTAERVLTNTSVASAQGLDLGLQRNDIRIFSNSEGRKIAFTAGGDLWTYDHDTGRQTRVFSFRGNELTEDDRIWDPRHGVRVVRVDDAGNILFTVYGYIPAGPHEGEDGLGIYRYNAENRSVEETVFFPIDQSYEILESSLSELVYANAQREVFLLLGTDLCLVDPVRGTCTVLRRDVQTDFFYSSRTQRTVAWMDPADDGGADVIQVLDLETRRTEDIVAGAGEKLYGIGFINEDFICGYARNEDILRDALGNVTPGLYRLTIRGTDGTVLKDYQKEGRVITATEWEQDNLGIELSERTEGGFAVKGEDHIINNAGSEEEIRRVFVSDQQLGTRMEVQFDTVSEVTEFASDLALFRRNEGGEASLEVNWPTGEAGGFFVYGRGRFLGACDVAGEAVQMADEAGGTVLNAEQVYVWERGNWPATANVDPAGIPEAVLTTSLDEGALAGALGDKYEVLNLGGCSQESLFYRLSRGSAVIAKSGPAETMLLVGYDRDNFWYRTGNGDETKAIATDDSRKLFAENGNSFLSYLED